MGQFHSARHDLPLTHRTARCLSLLLSAPLHPRRALPFSPAAVSAKTALVRRASDSSGAEPQREHKQPSTIRTRLHCETGAPSTPPTRTRLDSPLRSAPACRAPRRARASAAPPRPLRSHTVHTTDSKHHSHSQPQPQPQPSQCATPSALGPPARSPLKVYERLRPRQRCLSLRAVFASHHRLSRSPPRSRARPSPRRACSVHGHYTPG
jgi:hypothetical protein